LLPIFLCIGFCLLLKIGDTLADEGVYLILSRQLAFCKRSIATGMDTKGQTTGD